MFIVSLKASKTNVITFVVCLALVIGVSALYIMSDKAPAAATINGMSVNYSAKDTAEMVAFLKQYGWDVDPDTAETKEVIIPSTFDETYDKYNRIQKKQNLDLTKYRSKRVKQVSMPVTNYPGMTKGVNANLLIYEDKVIGGDISSTELDGFMHGFELSKE